MIDENWTKQAAFLCEMMERLALPVNSLIKTMIAKQIKVVCYIANVPPIFYLLYFVDE